MSWPNADDQWLDRLPRWDSLMHGDDALIKEKEKEYLVVLESIRVMEEQAKRIAKEIASRQQEISRDSHAV